MEETTKLKITSCMDFKSTLERIAFTCSKVSGFNRKNKNVFVVFIWCTCKQYVRRALMKRFIVLT